MENEDLIVNRVASSSLVSFDLEKYRVVGDRVLIDIKDQLYQGLVLREKDFRAYVQNHDWLQYRDSLVAVNCSADAIIPTWAYMLLAIALGPHARMVIFGTLEELEVILFRNALAKMDWSQFSNAKVVVKGCSDGAVPIAAYFEAADHLRGVASSVMFGEPCSTVPLFKRPR
jgi:hypothetical protein